MHLHTSPAQDVQTNNLLTSTTCGVPSRECDECTSPILSLSPESFAQAGQFIIVRFRAIITKFTVTTEASVHRAIWKPHTQGGRRRERGTETQKLALPYNEVWQRFKSVCHPRIDLTLTCLVPPSCAHTRSTLHAPFHEFSDKASVLTQALKSRSIKIQSTRLSFFIKNTKKKKTTS